MEYFDCPVVCKLERKKTPLIATVPTDEFTKMVEANFDYDFTGESKFTKAKGKFSIVKKYLGQSFDAIIIGKENQELIAQYRKAKDIRQ